MAFFKATHFQNIVYGSKTAVFFTSLFLFVFYLAWLVMCVMPRVARDLDYPPWDVDV